MTSLCKKESICAVHEKQTQAKQLSVKQQVRQHGARLQVTDSDGITMRKRLATQPETSPRGSMHRPMGLQSRTTNHSPCALELSSEPTRRILELSENYTHSLRPMSSSSASLFCWSCWRRSEFSASLIFKFSLSVSWDFWAAALYSA